MEIDVFINEIKPNLKQEKKLRKYLSQISITQKNNLRKFCLPIGMGVPYRGGFAAIDDLRLAKNIKCYRGNGDKTSLVLVEDKYNNLWLRMNYEDRAYGDFRELYIGVNSEVQADGIVSKDLYNNEDYYYDHPNFYTGDVPKNLRYPYLICNSISHFCFYTQEIEQDIEDVYKQLIYSNDIIHNIFK